MQTSPNLLELEQLTIRIFSYFPRWKRARFQPFDWSGISFTVAPENLAYSRWDHLPAYDFKEIEEACYKMLNQRPMLRFVVPPDYVMTPLGPIPGELRDKIVLAMDPAKDDLRNSESWLRTVKRIDGR